MQIGQSEHIFTFLGIVINNVTACLAKVIQTWNKSMIKDINKILGIRGADHRYYKSWMKYVFRLQC